MFCLSNLSGFCTDFGGADFIPCAFSVFQRLMFYLGIWLIYDHEEQLDPNVPCINYRVFVDFKRAEIGSEERF